MTIWATDFFVILAVQSTPIIFLKGALVFTLALVMMILIATLIVFLKMTLSRNDTSFGEEWLRSARARRWIFDQIFGTIEVIAAALLVIPIARSAFGELYYPLNVILLLSCIVVTVIVRDGIRRFLREPHGAGDETLD
ncbi:MAG: hypothetical protein O2955_07145 [Planctomycetota bacterium]|nr:hypothetical protein [Planctomycetota bacterium]MDA1212273.1 hypothetical protein [Planctomycetota bacterium]